jgi:asparagine synthase (glutamine-hydrolysing)
MLGRGILNRVLGDFAFVIWDGSRKHLFCARDPIGVKPFYYYCDGRTFLCGSELQEILAHPAVAPEPNEEFIGAYLSGRIIDRNSTLYRHVFRLEPGHSMTLGSSGMRKRRYFDLNSSRIIRHKTNRDYGDHFLEVFKSAVLSRLCSHNGTVAAELSGGLDSSMTVGTSASMMLDGTAADLRFETFSLVFPDAIADERDFIAEMTEMWDLRSNLVPAFVADLPDCLATLGRYRDFIGPPNHAMGMPMMAQAAERGFHVMLTGSGGDEWFGGSRAYLGDLLLGLRLIEAIAYARSHIRQGGRREYGRLLRDGLWGPLIPPRWKPTLRHIRGATRVPAFINKDFARRIHLKELLDWEEAPPPGLTCAQFKPQ